MTDNEDLLARAHRRLPNEPSGAIAKTTLRAYLWALGTIAAMFVLAEVVSFERLVHRLVPGSLCATHAIAILDARARDAALTRQAPPSKLPAQPTQQGQANGATTK